jgi:hypothetical protein
MRLRRAGPAAALLLVACTSGPAPEPVDAYPPLTARIVIRADDQVIEIRSLGPRAIFAATLHVPGQPDTEAFSIDSQSAPGERTNQTSTISQGAGMGSVVSGSVTLVGQIASLAQIRVTHPADYAAHWQEARIEVSLGQGQDRRVEMLPAPASR